MNLGSGSGGPTTYEFTPESPTVARLRVQAPEAEHFFIRGNVPVPKGFIVDGNVQSQLAVVSQPADAFAITQVETVSRYPDAADGADVVEVIAHVRRPHVAPGTPLDYKVVFHPHMPRPFQLSEDVDALLSAPGAIRLVATDPFGHRYATDLTAKRRASDPGVETIRRGSLVHETMSPEVLLPVEPVAGSEGTLPRMMGVNAFVRTFAGQDYFAIDLFVHNAFDGKDPSTTTDDAIHDLYFRSLALELPEGWHVLHVHEDPFTGPAVPAGNVCSAPLVAPLAQGKMHLMHRQSQFSRRIVIARETALADARVEARRQNLAFCVSGSGSASEPLWSWWNPDTARYMPQNHRLPDLSMMTSPASIDAEGVSDYAELSHLVRTGTAGQHPVQSPALGWAHPFGVAYGGMTGGERIDQIPGVHIAWSGSQAAYRTSELRSKMIQERQPSALVNSSGSPTLVEDHVRYTGNPHGPWLPFGMMFTLDPNQNYFFQNPVTFQADYVRSSGLQPDYEGALRSFQPIDLQHLIRYTGDLLTLTWLGNDSIAKHQISMSGEIYRMTHHDGYTGTGNYTDVATMKRKKLRVAEFPGTGVDYRRGEAWGLHVATADYAIGDDEKRERYRPWFTEVVRTIRAGQSECTGNIMASFIHQYGDGTMLTRQAFEVSFIVNAMEAIRTTVFVDVDEEIDAMVRGSIVDCAYSSIQAPFWDESFGGLRNVTAVGMRDGSIADFCTNLPPNASFGNNTVETKSPLTLWAYGYALSGDGEFLVKASRALGSSSNLEAEIGILGPGMLIHSAFMLGILQELNVQ